MERHLTHIGLRMCVREGLVESQLLTPGYTDTHLASWAYLGCLSPKVTLEHEFDSPAWGMDVAD